MADRKPEFSIDAFPPEMVAAVPANAERDAESVACFLHHLGLEGEPDNPLPLPPGFLLYLASALRLLDWETQGFSSHREAGLPEVRAAIIDAFRQVDDPNADAKPFCVAVLRLAVERFAWGGQTELGADVALEDPQEELLLEALADFLWANRAGQIN
jgi:hypothetical protein